MNATRMTNPFMPSFGRFPKIVIDQQEALTDYLTGLQTHDAKYQTSLVYGARGAGKTVFLLNVQKSLRQLDNWCFIRLNNGQGNLLFQLLHGLQKATGTSFMDLLKSVKSVSLMGNSISWQTLQASNLIDYDEYLSELLRRLKNKASQCWLALMKLKSAMMSEHLAQSTKLSLVMIMISLC